MSNRFIWVGAALAVLAAAAGCGQSGAEAAPDAEVRVAAAANLQIALGEVIAEFQAEHEGVEVAVTYGSSGTFVQQIGNGAPFDVFLAADLVYVDDVVEAGLADESDVFSYAVGRLAVWATDGAPADPGDGLEALIHEDLDTVAIANPEHAPYGEAAVAAMESAAIYDQVEDKLVRGENIAQAAEFAQSGNADIGIIALSLALSPELSASGTYGEVPLEMFPRLEQGGVVLDGAAEPEAARTFTGYLTGDDGQEILERYGYHPPGTGRED